MTTIAAAVTTVVMCIHQTVRSPASITDTSCTGHALTKFVMKRHGLVQVIPWCIMKFLCRKVRANKLEVRHAIIKLSCLMTRVSSLPGAGSSG